MIKGIRLVGICKNLRDTTSQNFPASLIKNTGCTVEKDGLHCDQVPGHDDGPDAVVGHDRLLHFDAAVAG